LFLTYRRVFDWMIGFIDTLYTPLGTTGNYSALAIPHTLQFTVTHTLGFSVFTSRILATDFNIVVIPASHKKSSMQSQIPFLPFLLKHLLLQTQSYSLLQLPTPELDSELILAAWDPRYIASGRTHRKYHFLYCCVLIHCCRDVFTAQLRSSERGADPERTPLATPFLMFSDVTAYVSSSSAECVRAIT
jgi:hypothetical protein